MSKAFVFQHDAFYRIWMLEAFGETQKNALFALRGKKDGLTADQLAVLLEVTRTAIRQHMATLQELGYIDQDEQKETGGRPAILYKLSEKGFGLFPKQYAWFSEVMLEMIRKERGAEGFANWMDEMGTHVGKGLLPQLAGMNDAERLNAIRATMNQLAYEAAVVAVEDSYDGKGIEATNCVYHALAARFPEVCKFDIALLSTLTGKNVDHQTCMARGAGSCRFAFTKK